jgi:hypothetical protein
MVQPPTLTHLRERHQDLLKRLEAAKEQSTLVPDAEQFLAACRESGRQIADPADREYLHGLMSFWANWLFAQTRTYPDTTLFPPDEEALAQKANQTMYPPQTVPIPLPGASLLPSWLLWAGAAVAAFVLLVGLILAGRGVYRGITSAAATAVPVVIEGTPGVEPGTPTAPPVEQVVEAVVDTEVLTGSGTLFVQVVSPPPGQVVYTGDEIAVQLTYSNLQPDWQVFLTMQRGTAGLLIPLTSFPVTAESKTGLWEARITIPRVPNKYYIGALVATTSQAAALIEQSDGIDDTQLPPGILPFPRLSVVEAVAP